MSGKLFVALVLFAVIGVGCTEAQLDGQDMARCLDAPQRVTWKLGTGITAEGFNTHVTGTQMVENNDGSPWTFISAEIVAPGMEGERPVWATAYIDPQGNADFLAVNTLASEFSVWDKPGGGNDFASKFDDEIRIVKQCVDNALYD